MNEGDLEFKVVTLWSNVLWNPPDKWGSQFKPEVQSWIKENVKGFFLWTYFPTPDRQNFMAEVQFENAEEAMKFKLTWA